MKIYLFILLIFCANIGLSQEKKIYNIGILIDNKTVETQKLLAGLQQEIKGVIGEDAIINFPPENMLANNFQWDKAQENYNQLSEGNTDIILAFGLINNQIIAQKSIHKKPTILFGSLNQDVATLDLNKKKSGIPNFTYLIDRKSFADDLNDFRKLVAFKNIGIIVDQPFANLLPLEETFGKALKPLGVKHQLIVFEKFEDIIPNIKDVDAIYLAGGFFLSSEKIQTLSSFLIERKIPSFTSNGIEQVEDGLMAANFSENDITQSFRRIALSIEAYIGGTDFSELSVFIDYTPSVLTLNYNTAVAVNIPMKYSLINEANFVGEFKQSSSHKQYNLLEVIDKALKNNLTLQDENKKIELSNQKIKSAKSNYLPTASIGLNGTYTDPRLAKNSFGQTSEFQTGGNLTVQQPLFSPQANADIFIQKSLQKAQQEQFNTEQLNTIFNASNAYFNLLILKTNVEIQFQNLKLTKENLQVAQQKFDIGTAGKSDLLRFKSQIAQNTQALIEGVSQLEQGVVSLNQLLNNSVQTAIDIKDVQLNKGIFKEYNYDQFASLLDDPRSKEPFIDFLILEALKNSPELKALDHNLDVAERSIKLYNVGRFLPTVAIQGQYNQIFSRTGEGSVSSLGGPVLNNNYNIGINVSVPLFGPNQTNINRRTATIQKEQLDINKQSIELTIAANINKSVLNLVNQVSNIDLSSISEQTAKEALELMQAAYSNGAVSLIQLLDAQSNYLNAQLAHTNAVYNYLISVLQIERFLGHYFLLSSKEEGKEFMDRFFEFMKNRKN